MKRVSTYLMGMLCLLGLCTELSAQSFKWAGAFGGSLTENPVAMSNDKDGNIYLTGYFNASGDFNPGPGTETLTFQGTTISKADIYIVKLTAEGVFCWAKQMGSKDLVRPIDLVIDDSANIYLMGNFMGAPLDCDLGTDTSFLNANGNSQTTFLCKYDSSAELIWNKKFDATTTFTPSGLEIDGGNNLYIGGQHIRKNIDYNIGPDTLYFYENFSGVGYLIKLNRHGEFIRFMNLGGSYEHVSFMNDQMVVSGTFSNLTDFNPGPGVDTLRSTGDVYVSRLDTAGNYGSTQGFGSPWAERVCAARFLSNGDYIVVGAFAGTADFDPGAGTDTITAYGTGNDIFISYFSASNQWQWAKRIGGTEYDRAFQVTIDPQDNIALCGYFGKTVDFDPGPGVHNVSVHGGTGFNSDFFVLKLNQQGQFVWVTTTGGNGPDIANDMLHYGTSYYVYGSFQVTADFDFGLGIKELTAQDNDAFVQIIKDCTPTYATSNVQTCGPYTGPDGKSYAISGNYSLIIPNSTDCDSIITLQLTITEITKQIAIQGSKLVISESNADSVVWINCENMTAIQTSNTKEFEPTTSGNYGAIIYKAGCSDTTSCLNFQKTGLNQLKRSEWKAIPNPSNGTFKLASDNFYGQVTLEIYDMQGRKIQEHTLNSSSVNLQIEGAAGMYLARIIDQTGVHIIQLLIQE